MTRRVLPAALGVVVAVIALTWAIENVLPPPYSGYLAAVIVGFIIVEFYKRRPPQRAARMLRIYLKARERGADEAEARGRLLARLYRREESRAQARGKLEAAWQGPSEKDRAMSGLGALLRHEGKTLDDEALGHAWNRLRDLFPVTGWEALPRPFVEAVRGRLDAREQTQLEDLALRYRLFEQRFFRGSASLEADPAAGAMDFARLLHSMGNRLTREQPGDAERAYRMSLRLRADRNLAHAGLALLLEQTGRTREAAREARLALAVLDEHARRAADEPPSTEDIGPFRSPQSLREALEPIASGEPESATGG
jgi:hypothetical protein